MGLLNGSNVERERQTFKDMSSEANEEVELTGSNPVGQPDSVEEAVQKELQAPLLVDSQQAGNPGQGEWEAVRCLMLSWLLSSIFCLTIVHIPWFWIEFLSRFAAAVGPILGVIGGSIYACGCCQAVEKGLEPKCFSIVKALTVAAGVSSVVGGIANVPAMIWLKLSADFLIPLSVLCMEFFHAALSFIVMARMVKIERATTRAGIVPVTIV